MTNVASTWPESGEAYRSNSFTASLTPATFSGVDIRGGGYGARLQHLWWMNVTYQPVRAARKAREMDRTWADEIAIRVNVEQGSFGQTVLESGSDAQQLFVPTDWEDEWLQGAQTPATPPSDVTIVSPIATAIGATQVPTLQVTLLPSIATATADAPIPLILIGLFILPPIATATGIGLTPIPKSTLLPPIATATGDGLIPTLRVTLLPPIATATGAPLVPVLQVVLAPSIATATGIAFVPILIISGGAITIVAPIATAQATGIVAVVIGGAVVYLSEGGSSKAGFDAASSKGGSLVGFGRSPSFEGGGSEG
jgi:hypothetical protein